MQPVQFALYSVAATKHCQINTISLINQSIYLIHHLIAFKSQALRFSLLRIAVAERGRMTQIALEYFIIIREISIANILDIKQIFIQKYYHNKDIKKVKMKNKHISTDL